MQSYKVYLDLRSQTSFSFVSTLLTYLVSYWEVIGQASPWSLISVDWKTFQSHIFTGKPPLLYAEEDPIYKRTRVLIVHTFRGLKRGELVSPRVFTVGAFAVPLRLSSQKKIWQEITYCFRIGSSQGEKKIKAGSLVSLRDSFQNLWQASRLLYLGIFFSGALCCRFTTKNN